MSKNYRKGLARKYYVFLVNLKMEIENNPYISVNYLLREHHIDIRLNSVLYDLEIITRGRKTEWLALEPTTEMAQKCMTGVRAKRYTEKNKSDKYYNTTHTEYQKLNPNAIRVGSGYYHKPKKRKEKTWIEVFKFRIFNLKCKFFKLK